MVVKREVDRAGQLERVGVGDVEVRALVGVVAQLEVEAAQVEGRVLRAGRPEEELPEVAELVHFYNIIMVDGAR